MSSFLTLPYITIHSHFLPHLNPVGPFSVPWILSLQALSGLWSFKQAISPSWINLTLSSLFNWTIAPTGSHPFQEAYIYTVQTRSRAPRHHRVKPALCLDLLPNRPPFPQCKVCMGMGHGYTLVPITMHGTELALYKNLLSDCSGRLKGGSTWHLHGEPIFTRCSKHIRMEKISFTESSQGEHGVWLKEILG